MKLLSIITSIAALGLLVPPEGVAREGGRGGGGQVSSRSWSGGGAHAMRATGPRGGQAAVISGPRGGQAAAISGPRGRQAVAISGPRGGQRIAVESPSGRRTVAATTPGGRRIVATRPPAVAEREMRGMDWGRRHGWTHRGGHWYRHGERTNIVFVPGVYPWLSSDWGYGGYGYGYAPTVSLPAVGESLAADVQSELARQGFYNGPIDGIVGPGTRAAIRSYQAANGLAINGQISSSLVASLGL